ncbi:MAG: phosphoglycolate phosphatase [Desulfurococcaceae archaeon]
MGIITRALFVDVDGTLTINRNTYKLSLEAISALSKLVSKGIVVSLVSSNALPLVVGLLRYIGLNGYAIGETGCLVFNEKRGLVSLSSRSAKVVYLDLLREFGEYVEDSWQNVFRLYEYALRLRERYRDNVWVALEEMRNYVNSKYSGFTVDYSGYAFHVRPFDVDKRKAVLYVLNELGIDPSEAAGVGDSYMDAVFLRELGLSAAVSNADDNLKRDVSIVLSKPSGLGVAEFVEMILGDRG